MSVTRRVVVYDTVSLSSRAHGGTGMGQNDKHDGWHEASMAVADASDLSLVLTLVMFVDRRYGL